MSGLEVIRYTLILTPKVSVIQYFDTRSGGFRYTLIPALEVISLTLIPPLKGFQVFFDSSSEGYQVYFAVLGTCATFSATGTN